MYLWEETDPIVGEESSELSATTALHPWEANDPVASGFSPNVSSVSNASSPSTLHPWEENDPIVSTSSPEGTSSSGQAGISLVDQIFEIDDFMADLDADQPAKPSHSARVITSDDEVLHGRPADSLYQHRDALWQAYEEEADPTQKRGFLVEAQLKDRLIKAREESLPKQQKEFAASGMNSVEDWKAAEGSKEYPLGRLLNLYGPRLAMSIAENVGGKFARFASSAIYQDQEAAEFFQGQLDERNNENRNLNTQGLLPERVANVAQSALPSVVEFMAASAATTPVGALAYVSANKGNEAYVRDVAKGISKDKALLHGTSAFATEMVVTGLFMKFGSGGSTEELLSGAGSRSITQIFQGLGEELGEEAIIAVADHAIERGLGLAEELTDEEFKSQAIDLVLGTAIGYGAANGVNAAANFIAEPTRTNVRKAKVPPELIKTRKKREEIASQAEVVATEIKSINGLSTRINNLDKKGLLDADLLEGVRSLAESDPKSARSIFTEAERRAEEHNDQERSFRDEFKDVFGSNAVEVTRITKKVAEEGGDYTSVRGFDHYVEKLRNDPGFAPGVYARAMNLGDGNLDDGVFQVLQNGQNQQAMKSADDFVSDVAEEALTSFGVADSDSLDSDSSEAEFSPSPESADIEGMPNVADIPGSAPKGRFGPLESEQAFRTVETSAEALVDVDKPITPREIIDSIEEVGQAFGADVPIRGNLLGRAKRALGYYMPSQAVIRLEARFDAATAAHEIGHAVLRGMKIDSPAAMKQAVGRTAHAEMVKLGRALYGDKAPAGGYYNEGLAEFFRYYIARSSDAAKQKAPRFFEAFETLVANHPGGLEAMQKAQQQIKLWGDQGAIARLDAQQIDTSSRKYKRAEALRRWKKKKPIVRHIEEFEPLREFTRAYQSGGGKQVEGTVFDPYAKAKERRGRSNAHLDRMIETEMVDINGNPIGESLHEALAPIDAKDYEDFQRYLFARRALALYDSSKGARDPGIARKDAEYNYNTFSSPKFSRAAHNLHKWWEGVLDYASDASPEIARNVERTREQNIEEFGVSHGYYVPLHRIIDDDGRGVQSSSSGGKQLSGRLSKQLRGSALPVKEVLPQLVAKASSLMQAAHRRAVADSVFSLYDSFRKDPRNQSLGRYLEPIPEATVAVDVPLEQVIKQFRKALSVMGLSETEVFGMDGLKSILEDPTDMTDVVDQALATFYVRSGKAKNAKNESPILTRFEDGRMSFYRADQNLYDALLPAPVALVQTIRNIPAFNLAYQGIVNTNSVARTGMVGLRAGFSLVTSPIRELQGLVFHSAEINPLALAHDYLSGVFQAGTYVFSGGTVEMDWMKTFHRLGVQMASPLAEDSMNTRRAAKRAVKSRTAIAKAGRVVDVRNWYYFVRDIFQAFDAAPRIAEIKRVARKHKWTPDMPLTEEVALDMGLRAKEVTADFGAGSPASREMNRVFLFWNIALQGPRATVRAVKDHPVKSMATLATATALTLANWWDNKDEEWWKERNRREDFSYIRVRIGDEVVRIPINQEASQIPQAIMVMMDAAYNRDPEAATEYFGAVVDLLKPSLPVLAEYYIESKSNRRSYNDAPIVPTHLLRASPEDQFGAYTSETTKAIGAALKISPARIDHAVRTFAGGLGGDLLGVSDTMMRLAKGDKEKSPGIREWADTPLVGRLFQRGGIYGTRPASFDKVYESYAKAEKRQFSTRNPETEDERQLRLQLLDGKKAMSALLNLRSLAVDSIAKRQLTRAAVKLAKDIVQDYESKNLRRGEWRGKRKKLVREAKQAGG